MEPGKGGKMFIREIAREKKKKGGSSNNTIQKSTKVLFLELTAMGREEGTVRK